MLTKMRPYAITFTQLAILSVLIPGRGLTGQDAGLSTSRTNVQIVNVLVTPRHEANIPAEMAGRVRELLVRPGDHVEVGQVLARIDARESRAEVESVSAELRRLRRAADDDSRIRLADKKHALAVKDHQRAIRSAERVPKSVSEAELDRLKLAVDQSEIECERARIDHELGLLVLEEKALQLTAAQLRLEKHNVSALRSGVIAEQLIELGEWVTPGEPIFRAITVDAVRVEGLLPGTVTPQHFAGAQAVISINGHTKSFLGIVQFVAPEQNRVNGETRFWVLLKNSDGRLRPGDHGTMRLTAKK
ncbi:MAG: HlyD family efflux transporter periplasmic adaptor subunit [Pirellulaceae bacterium]